MQHLHFKGHFRSCTIYIQVTRTFSSVTPCSVFTRVGKHIFLKYTNEAAFIPG